MNEHYWNERKFGEPLPKLRIEQDEPEHFGCCENIKIFDYNTEHFDICRSAVILYNKLVEILKNFEKPCKVLQTSRSGG